MSEAIINGDISELRQVAQTEPYDFATAATRVLVPAKAGFKPVIIGGSLDVAAGASFKFQSNLIDKTGNFGADWQRELGKEWIVGEEGQSLDLVHTGAFAISGYVNYGYVGTRNPG